MKIWQEDTETFDSKAFYISDHWGFKSVALLPEDREYILMYRPYLGDEWEQYDSYFMLNEAKANGELLELQYMEALQEDLKKQIAANPQNSLRSENMKRGLHYTSPENMAARYDRYEANLQTIENSKKIMDIYVALDGLGDDMSQEAQAERVKLAEQLAGLEEQERQREEQEQQNGFDIER